MFSLYSSVFNPTIYNFVSTTDDFSRVVLEKLPDEPDSDYVNASYMDVSLSYDFFLFHCVPLYRIDKRPLQFLERTETYSGNPPRWRKTETKYGRITFVQIQALWW